MKRLILCTLFLAGITTLTATAQQASKPADTSTKGSFVADDDGGLTEIVPADVTALSPREATAAPVMKSVFQVSIFLGAGWGDHPVRSREVGLLDLAASGKNSGLAELHQHKVELLPAAPRVEDFTDLSKASVNDLTIQRKLVQMLEQKVIPAPAANTIYVVFLAPGISSTLGTSKGGIDYSAYHNLLHLDLGEIRYVVVPYHENADRQTAAASRAFADTAFNPSATTN